MHRIQRQQQQQQQQQQDSSALTTQTEAGFSSPFGTLSSYNGHVYTTTSSSAIKHITAASATTANVKGPSGQAFTQISYDGESSFPSVCGITSTGLMYCSKGKLTDTPIWVKLTGTFQQVVIRNGKLIALRKDGFVVYTTYDANIGMSDSFSLMNGLPMISQISYDGRTICVITSYFALYCHDSGFVPTPKWRTIIGSDTSGYKLASLDSVQIEGNEMIVVQRDNIIWYATYQPSQATATTQQILFKQMSRKFTQISIDQKNNKIWGIDTNGILYSRPGIIQGSTTTFTAAWTIYKI